MLSVENRARIAFAAVILGGLISGLVWYLHHTSEYTTYQIVTHDSVSGLMSEAPVELHGVEVGRVSKVKLLDAHTVSILLHIRKDAPITTTTIATITSRGLASKGFTGYVYIAMEDSADGKQRLTTASNESYPRIPTVHSRSLSLDSAVSQVNQNVQELTQLLRTVLDRKTIASFKEAVDNLQQVTQMLAENNNKLSVIIRNAEQASGQFKPLLDSSNNTVRALQTQVLPQTYQTLDKLNRLSDSMQQTINKIDRNPAVLLRGSEAPPAGPGESK